MLVRGFDVTVKFEAAMDPVYIDEGPRPGMKTVTHREASYVLPDEVVQQLTSNRRVIDRAKYLLLGDRVVRRSKPEAETN